MKRIIIISSIMLLSHMAKSQEWLNNALREIEQNNLEVKSYSLWRNAKVANSKIGITPSNPFIESGWYPAVDKSGGIKKTWGITQSFDFPTVYFQRVKASATNKLIAEAEYQMYRQEVLLDAKLAIINYVYAKKIKDQLQDRLSQAAKISDLFKKRLDTGDISVLDYKVSQNRLIEAKDNLASSTSEFDQLTIEINRLNNGKSIILGDTLIAFQYLPDIDTVINTYKQLDPRFQLIKLNLKKANEELSLAKNEWLPEFEIGYESEKTNADTFRGVKIGLAIPLWEKTGKIKYARIAESALTSEMQNLESILESEIKQEFAKSQSLILRLKDYRKTISTKNTIELLIKALDSGHISAIDYFNEVEYIYNQKLNELRVERDFLISTAIIDRYQL